MIPPGMEIPESTEGDVNSAAARQDACDSSRPLSVAEGYRNAKSACSARKRRVAPTGSDLENVVVDVEITDWPTATQNPRGRVVEILGYEDDFGVDVEIMIRKFHLPHRFPRRGAGRRRRTPSRSFQPAEAAQAARLPRISRSSPLTAKRRATSTMPFWSASWRTATSNCRFTSPTSPTT